MGKAIFQIKNNDKMYNKFVLLKSGKDKENNEVFGFAELMANKDVRIQYYNQLLVEGDFDSLIKKTEFSNIIDFFENKEIVTYINNNFKEIEKILK